MHGLTHVPGGADPIPFTAGIQYDIENNGGWLYVGTSDTSAGAGSPYSQELALDVSPRAHYTTNPFDEDTDP
jgi:hypothetical protein